MKQKNYRWVFYILAIILFGGIIYIAAKDITPISRHVEKNIEINYTK